MIDGFQRVLDHIRSIAGSEYEKGRLFERLMKRYFQQDPLYRDRFSNVWLWGEWSATRPDFSANDTGIDLVAEEREGGVCAIQCKCYAPGTRISKKHLDSFISASAPPHLPPPTLVVTRDAWGAHAAKNT
ncbi:MAG: restriction endonuclease, partial [Bryobacterales bacterium]|nr:restriction endonuclease [Bryobacterales bacterium]